MRFWSQLGVILGAKIHPNRVLEVSWAHLERVLKRLGAILGHLGRGLEPSWHVLGRFGASWMRFKIS